jgi:hypothetical protein
MIQSGLKAMEKKVTFTVGCEFEELARTWIIAGLTFI